MWNMIWPILIIVMSNTIYNICAKSTPGNVNSFASLSISYVVAALFAVIMFFITSEQKNLMAELSKTNWTAYVLGMAIRHSLPLSCRLEDQCGEPRSQHFSRLRAAPCGRAAV